MRKAIALLGVAGLFLASVAGAATEAFATLDRLPKLESNAVLVFDQQNGRPILGKNTNAITPIASITKLMTAIVVLDSGLPLDDLIAVTEDDLDYIKGTRSRLHVGVSLTRWEALKLALMASENRAASALGRNYPGGKAAFVAAMNRKAQSLGMADTHFVDSTGLDPANVSTARDLVKLVDAGYGYDIIREFTTSEDHLIALESDEDMRVLEFNNSNRLVRNPEWEIGLSKTGYISEAGRCLVMQAKIAARPVIIVLLDSWGKLSRIGDANRIKNWLEGKPEPVVVARHHAKLSKVKAKVAVKTKGRRTRTI